ncbi:MAG: flagellar filament capping protein FliD [Myxococcota bacterium]
MATTVSGRATFGGIASGLDTKAIIDGLMQIERQPLQRIQSRRDEIDGQRSLMRQLNTKLLALRDAANGLDNRNSKLTAASTDEEFLKYTSSSTNEDVVSVTAGVGAAPGDIQVLVEQLARGSRRFSTALSGDKPSDVVALQAGQSITIDLPNADDNASPEVAATHIVITAPADGAGITLSDLREKINNATENRGKVRADILTVSEGSYRLVLSSADTGTKGQLAITGDLALEAERDEDKAQGSKITLFGQTIERDTNDIDGVLTGVTLRLKGLAAKDDNGQPITETVSIKTDFDAVSGAIQSFVDAYNDVMSFIDSQAKYNEQTKSAGPLSGDFMVREVQRRLREAVSNNYSFEKQPGNPFSPDVDDKGKRLPGGSISGIGIELAGNGRLRLNKDKLQEALTQNATAVKDFLSGYDRLSPQNQDAITKAKADNVTISAYNHQAELFNATRTDPKTWLPLKELKPVPADDMWDEGFFTKLSEQLDSIVRSGDGLLAQRDQQFATRLKDIDTSIDAFNSRLSSREEMLTQRFSSLESVIAGLQNQQGFLGSLK